jgi:hypothetical protein
MFDLFISNILKYLQSFTKYITAIEIIYGLLGVAFIVVLVMLFVFSFTKRTQLVTQGTIDYFKDNGKYIQEVFVEINNSKESLRYFIFGKRWKIRIVKSLNKLYANFYGTILRKSLINNRLKFRFNNLNSTKKIRQELKVHRPFFDKIEQNDESTIKSDYRESIWLITVSRFAYTSTIENLLNYCDFLTSKFIIMIGSAGNGKTNLVCSLSELILQLNSPCVLINARDIDSNVSDYFWQSLNKSDTIKKYRKLIIHLINMLLHLRRKNLYGYALDAGN